jgi:hypothetical protein
VNSALACAEFDDAFRMLKLCSARPLFDLRPNLPKDLLPPEVRPDCSLMGAVSAYSANATNTTNPTTYSTDAGFLLELSLRAGRQCRDVYGTFRLECGSGDAQTQNSMRACDVKFGLQVRRRNYDPPTVLHLLRYLELLLEMCRYSNKSPFALEAATTFTHAHCSVH